jgi:glycosyltransferase involved in cell wall biosynthesis
MKYIIFSQRCDVHYGAQIHVETILEECVRINEVTNILFVTWSNSGRLLDISSQNGIKCCSVGLIDTLKLIFFNQLRGHRLDCVKVFSHGTLAGYFCAFLRLFHKTIIHIHTLHGTPLSRLRFAFKNKCINYIFKIFETNIYCRSHLIFCSDSDLQDYKALNVQALSTKVIRYFRGSKPSLDEINSNGDKCRFVFVAGFRHQKRQLELMNFLANNVSFADNLHFTFIGDGPTLNECIQIKEKFKMDNVLFTGYQSPMVVSEILNTSHFGILLSNYEGQPLSAIEYLKYGLPILVNNANGLGELVVNNGILLEYDFSEDALRNSFVDLSDMFFNRRDKYLELKNNSLNMFVSHFGRENTIEEFFKSYMK